MSSVSDLTVVCYGQNPLYQFPRSKSVTSWRVKSPLCLLCRVVSQIPLQQLVANKLATSPSTAKLRGNMFNGFLQRVSIACYAERCISYDRFCPTVRPSVTRWYHAKTTLARIVQSSLEDSAMILVSSTLDFTAKFQGEHRERGRRVREG